MLVSGDRADPFRDLRSGEKINGITLSGSTYDLVENRIRSECLWNENLRNRSFPACGG